MHIDECLPKKKPLAQSALQSKIKNKEPSYSPLKSIGLFASLSLSFSLQKSLSLRATSTATTCPLSPGSTVSLQVRVLKLTPIFLILVKQNKPAVHPLTSAC